ncbi:MAG: maleylacetoacetate isomerase [Betaproteobacteria bacterium]|jgi:maleylpyruvate isomerase|nr:maleylacetoacetate isomerase [Betaproteobacteria bacterium]MDH5209171.1 maleylacetoacetate isomerase [Burkholderiaceae bacterium]
MKLYNYFRSSASFRVRIALNLKGLPYEYVVVHLTKDGGQQFDPSFRALNPDALIPVLADDDRTLTQSLAIIEYLEETHPEPPLLPRDAVERAYVRAIALGVACEIHPLNNLRVLRYLVRKLGASEEQKDAWYRHWVEEGLAAIEARLVAEKRTGRYALGDHVTLADVVLVPQIFNAMRFDCRLDHVPVIMGIFGHCMELPAFDDAQPSRQPDAE